MSDSTPLMTRYLLGELSEQERTAFETQYFEDLQLADQLSHVETELVDDYVRGRLAPDVRQRFETSYLTTPHRRDRVHFAQSLLATIDRRAGSGAMPPELAPTPSRGFAIRGPQLALGLAATLVLAVATAWLFLDRERDRPESTAHTAQPSPAGETASPSPKNATPPSPPPASPVLAVVTLTLAVGPGERSGTAVEPPTLTIPAGTDQVQLALTLREHDYARYRVVVRAIGGPELLRTGTLVPNLSGAQPAFTITVPAARVTSGDYMLTLQGAIAGGEYDDLSQTIFRIAMQP